MALVVQFSQALIDPSVNANIFVSERLLGRPTVTL
jgi:hypothetical protein